MKTLNSYMHALITSMELLKDFMFLQIFFVWLFNNVFLSYSQTELQSLLLLIMKSYSLAMIQVKPLMWNNTNQTVTVGDYSSRDSDFYFSIFITY